MFHAESLPSRRTHPGSQVVEGGGLEVVVGGDLVEHHGPERGRHARRRFEQHREARRPLPGGDDEPGSEGDRATAATIDQSTVWSAGSGAVAAAPLGERGADRHRRVRAERAGPEPSASVPTRRLGTACPALHALDPGHLAGRCTVAATDSIDICQPVPDDVPPPADGPAGTALQVSVVVEVIT